MKELIERIEGAEAEIQRLATFIAGIASRSINAPPGVHNEAHKSKMLREFRNGARLILNTAPKGFNYDHLITTRADTRGNGTSAGRDGSARLGHPPRRQGLSRAAE